MINQKHLISHIIEPTLKDIGMYSWAAVQLVLGTAAVESDMGYSIKQNGGPALGIYQMEPDTHDDIWTSYLSYRTVLSEKVRSTIGGMSPDPQLMIGNLYYATAMCRVHYYRVIHQLPEVNHIIGLAKYWKQHYNTPMGKGTEDKFREKYLRYITG